MTKQSCFCVQPGQPHSQTLPKPTSTCFFYHLLVMEKEHSASLGITVDAPTSHVWKNRNQNWEREEEEEPFLWAKRRSSLYEGNNGVMNCDGLILI